MWIPVIENKKEGDSCDIILEYNLRKNIPHMIKIQIHVK